MQAEVLNQVPIFSSLQADTCTAIARRAFTRNLPTGCTLLVEGLPAEFGYFVLSGELRALRMNQDGRVQVLARFRVGDPINLISLLSQEHVNRATIETLTKSTLLVLAASDFNDLIRHYPDFSTLLLHQFTWYPHDLWLYLMAAQWQRISQMEPFIGRAGSVRDILGPA